MILCSNGIAFLAVLAAFAGDVMYPGPIASFTYYGVSCI